MSLRHAQRSVFSVCRRLAVWAGIWRSSSPGKGSRHASLSPRAKNTRLGRKGSPSSPPRSRASELAWARTHPEIFGPLQEQGIFPLDPVPIFGRTLTLVEDFQRLFGANPPFDHELEGETTYHLRNPFGAKGFRGDPENKEVVRSTRPELVDFFRSSEVEMLRLQGKDARWQANYAISPPLKPARFSVSRPGVISGLRLSQLRSSPESTFWRISWRSFDTPEAAVEHLLNGGEHAELLRNSRQQLYPSARTLLARPSRDLLEVASQATMHNFDPDKFFLSVSNEKLDTIGESTGNLRIRIVSDRAFKVPRTASNAGEEESGIPLVLDPQEVRGAELNYKKGSSTRLEFLWSSDRSSVTVKVTEGKKKHTRTPLPL